MDKLEINMTRLRKLVKSAVHVGRQKNDKDLAVVGYLIEALEDDDLLAAISADIKEDHDEELVLDEESD